MKKKRKKKYSVCAGGIVLNQRWEIIITKKGDAWSLPKGKIKRGEQPQAAAIREIGEETGVMKRELHFVRMLDAYSRYKTSLTGGNDYSEWKVIIMFLFRTDKKTLKPEDPLHTEARWIAVGEALCLLTNKKDRIFLRKVRHAIR